MELLYTILRYNYLFLIAVNISMIVYMIIYQNKYKYVIYMNRYFISLLYVIIIIYAYTSIMSDLIHDTWHGHEIYNYLPILVINLILIVVTCVIVYLATYYNVICEDKIILNRLFKRKVINFIDIDIKKSELLMITPKPSKLFPNREIMHSRDYMTITKKNGESVKFFAGFILHAGAHYAMSDMIYKKLKPKMKQMVKN